MEGVVMALNRHELADVIEEYAAMMVVALREVETRPTAEPRRDADSADAASPPEAAAVSSVGNDWTEIEPIKNWETKWPLTEAWKALGHKEMREHYPLMRVYETHDDHGAARLAIGEPQERYPVYGKERGLLSVWEVVNGRPVRQLANFIEVDDFEKTGDRAALISGKDGAAKKGFAPNERHLLPGVYNGMRVEVQNDRIVGPNSRNRLAVVAREDEVVVMLDHALTHLRLRS
jgi:hypothetical protein